MSDQKLASLLASYKSLRAEIRMFDWQFVISALLQLITVVAFFELPDHSVLIYAPFLFGLFLFLRAGASSWWERIPAVMSEVKKITQIIKAPDVMEFDRGEKNDFPRQLFDFLFFAGAHLTGLICVIIQIIKR